MSNCVGSSGLGSLEQAGSWVLAKGMETSRSRLARRAESMGGGAELRLPTMRATGVPIPLERVAMRDDRLVVQGLTEDQIRAMPTFERNDRRYRDLDGNQQVQIST